MNLEDRAIEAAERDASPARFPSGHESAEPIARTVTASTSGSSSSSSSNESVQREEMRMSRMPTQRDNADLERQATALSRIQTARSQHSATVGASLTSRRSTKASRPLPPFGDGKPYPPLLPEREEYVVEFDGPDDPLHAMNWPMNKRWASTLSIEQDLTLKL
ncbi:hypothetical protein LTR28_008826, partial [Elasticomyces elasticus]